MKIIAFYLPQFHCIPENDKWWGSGFTEWVNVKKAQPLFLGHHQPRVPLNNNYYNLLNSKVQEWQVDVANKYGVYGFCLYHYWFDGKLLLEKPVESLLENKKLDTHYCICWANEHWTNAWSGEKATVLIQQKYGEKKEWIHHFEYLLRFFKDERYIKNNNKPLFVIYRPELIDCLNEMLETWDILAKENGFDGIDFAYQHAGFTVAPNSDESHFTYALEYHPNCAMVFKSMERNAGFERFKKGIITNIENRFGINLREKIQRKHLRHYNYDELWKYILNMKPRNSKCVPGAFVDWDNTPRRGMQGFVVDGATPTKFKEYMIKQIIHARKDYKKDMIFIFSWNEWAEGGYLEPDTQNGYGYLEALHNALLQTGGLEF